MPKTTSVIFAFTARRIEMAVLLLTDAISVMASKKAAATEAAEVAFYDKQTPVFQALVDLLTKTQKSAGKAGATRKVRLSAEQYHMLSGSLGARNLEEVRAIYVLPEGAERDNRNAAYTEWEQFRDALNAKDPRKFDTSQDAEDEDDTEDAEDHPESDD